MKNLKIVALVVLTGLLLVVSGCKPKTKSYTVSFDTDGGSSVASQTVVEGKSASKPATNPTKANYTFAGWYVNLTDTAEYDFSKAVTSDLKLHAKWIQGGNVNPTDPTHTISFDTNGGSEVGSIIVTENGTLSLPTPTREGYTFAGWYDGNTRVTSSTKVTKDMKLTAKWTKNSSSNNGGNNNNTTPTTNVAVTGVKLNKTSGSVTVGKSITLTATVTPSNATNKNVTWTSSDTKVATVSKGKVTGVKAGTATITVKTNNGKTATCKITVTAATATYTYKVASSLPSGLADIQTAIKVYDANGKDVTSSVEAVGTANFAKMLGEYDSSSKHVVLNKENLSSLASVVIGGKVNVLKKA